MDKRHLPKIGDKLFQVNTKILEYTVTGVQTLETDGHKQVFYILRCESCTDHDACVIAIKHNDYGGLEYSHMVNNYDDDDDDGYKNHQYYWHKAENQKFFSTRKEAKISILNSNITYYQSQVKELAERIKGYEAKLEAIKDDLTILQEQNDN